MRASPGACLIVTRAGVRVKRCSGCKVEQPLEAFTKGTGPGGYHRHCRACCKDYRVRRASPPTTTRTP